MALALFDLDNTLINGDSDYLWGQFLARRNIVEREYYERENQRFYDQYRAGNLDIHEFLRFSLRPLAEIPREQLLELRKEYFSEAIEPILLPAAQALINKHRRQGDLPVVITATNRFVTEPIAQAYGIEHLIATLPAMVNGEFSGEVEGTPCFQQGKVIRLNEWIGGSGITLAGSSFYSDSHNDLPLLELVDHPVAVDPDQTLGKIASDQNWPVISLRNHSSA